MKAMLLAAGRGERMRPLSDHVPKPLLLVAGKPLIVWHLERLAMSGVRDVVINHAHLGAQIEAALGDGTAFGLDIAYSPEPSGALETAGGVANALRLLGEEPFLLISSDIYADCDYRSLINAAARLDQDTLAMLWMVTNPPYHPAGDFVLADGYLRTEGETKLTYANLGIYRPEFFAGVEPGTRLPMLPLLQRAIAARAVKGIPFNGLWDNVGTPEQLHALDRLLRDRAPH